MNSFVHTTDLRDIGGTAWALFLEKAIEKRWANFSSFSWNTEEDLVISSLNGLFNNVIYSNEELGRVKVAILEAEYYLLFVFRNYFGNDINLHICSGNNFKDQQVILEDIKSCIPEMGIKDEIIPIKFWAKGEYGPMSFERNIVVPSWDDIKLNYNFESRMNLEFLFNEFKPAFGGQLILWSGLPGTGKTYALRALLKQWREWCRVNYIVDPEKFFGESDYMISTLLDSTSSKKEEVNKWSLFIFEDTGELIMADAKERVGQGLSRLLNVVDGIIGQGLNVLMLITTNEKIEKLHEAVSRPGRCAANIKFKTLDKSESEEWLKRNGEKSNSVTTSMTLAELYAILNKYRMDSKRSKIIGFMGE